MKWTKYLDKRPPYNKQLAISLWTKQIYLARYLKDIEVGVGVFLVYDNEPLSHNSDLNEDVEYWIELPELPED